MSTAGHIPIVGESFEPAMDGPTPAGSTTTDSPRRGGHPRPPCRFADPPDVGESGPVYRKGCDVVSKIRSALTYANVMATVAVFLALGGGAYAALKLPKNS